jgi:hypothetical protein
MLASEIIEKFEEYVDDTTELSTQEELALLNKVYVEICSDRPWEFLKIEASGVMTTTTTITLPEYFEYLVENKNYTDNSYSTEMNAKPLAVWIGNKQFQVVNWSDRRQYENTNGICYVDIRNNRIVFPVAQDAGATYSFDYKATPANLLIGGTPLFPDRFQHMIYHRMAAEDQIIQLFDKARSYADENRALAAGYFASMCSWNANLMNN